MTEEGDIIIEEELLKDPFVRLPVGLIKLQSVSTGGKLAYGMLLWYGWKYGRYPGHEQMGIDLGVGKRSVIRYMRDLEVAGLIKVERPGLGKTNSYRLPPLGDKIVTSTVTKVAHLMRQNCHPKTLDSVSDVKNENEERQYSSSSQQFSNDKTALISAIALEFAPTDPSQAIQTYLTRFPHALISKAAEITRAADNKHNPIAYLYGVIQRLQEQEAFDPLAHRHFEDIPELTPAEYEAALASLDRVKAQLAAQSQAAGNQ